jgi:hypothetical protein
LLLVPAELKYWYSLPAFSQLFLAMPNSSRKTGLPISAAHWDEFAMKPLAKVFAASRFAWLEFSCSRRVGLAILLIAWIKDPKKTREFCERHGSILKPGCETYCDQC